MRVQTVVIGGGQAGLAMSRALTDQGVEHVVLERGRVAERWRSERWSSLHLLTPRWLARLPGWAYRGPDPDGFMSRDEVVTYLEAYAGSFPAPVVTGVTVTSVERAGSVFIVETDGGTWHADAVVVATGWCDRPSVPPCAGRFRGDLIQVVPTRYRGPEDLPREGVLVVGASATGIQLAAEIHASGRPVTLAVGSHTRLPRTYRGRDIFFWLERNGILDRTAGEVRDLAAARGEPSLQLVGSTERRRLDLAVLQEQGVRLTGRLAQAEGATAWFADDLAGTLAAADAKLERQLRRIDAHIRGAGLEGEVPSAERLDAVPVPDAPARLHLRGAGIRTIVWATGYRRAYPWLRLPVLDGRGDIRHDGGVTPEPGLYVLGMNFLRRRKSSFLDGVGGDAVELAAHIRDRQARRGRAVA